MKWRISVLLIGLVLMVSAAGYTHHGYTPFYFMDQTVEITGVVKELKLRSPHSVLLVEVTEADGKKTIYENSGRGGGSLVKMGTVKSLAPGDIIKVVGHPSRIPGTYGIAPEKITKADGSVVPWGL